MNKLLLNESPLIILPSLASKIGLNEAVFLQQLHYWVQKSITNIDKQNWVYKTVEEWEEEFPFWSNSTIKRVIGSLKKMNILQVKKLSKNKRERVNYYAINYAKIDVFKVNMTQRGVQNEPMDKVNLTHSVGQNEPMNRVNLTYSVGQVEPIQKVNLPQCIYSKNQKTTQETTTEITSENTTESTHIFVREWNEFAEKNSLSQICSLSSNRKKQLNVRLKSPSFKKMFHQALEHIEQSDYLLGSKGWKVTFDWLIQNDENILKVVEGNYKNQEKKTNYVDSPLNNLPKTEKYVVGEW